MQKVQGNVVNNTDKEILNKIKKTNFKANNSVQSLSCV